MMKRLFDCDLCNKLLVDPVALVCGNTICQTHINEMLEKRSKRPRTFICELCEDEHVVPENGFVLNKKFKSQLEMKLYELKIDMSTYNSCKIKVNEARESVAELDSLSKDPENYIYEYFETLKRQVDCRREDLKERIDNYSEEIIQSMENTKQFLVQLSKDVSQLAEDVESSKMKLSNLTEKFDTFEFDDERLESIKNSMEHFRVDNSKIVVKYKEALLGHNKYSFEFNHRSIEEFFGQYNEVKMVNML